MDLILILGLSAVVLSSICGLPQLIKSIKTKSVKDLSLPAMILFLFAQFAWLAYGYLTMDVPLLLSSVMPIATYISLLLVYFKNRDTKLQTK